MTPFERQVSAAMGFLELGLPEEALGELEQLDPGMRCAPEALMVRASIFQTLGRWEEMGAAAQMLCDLRPEDAQWPLSLAYATRRAKSLERAVGVLMAAAVKFPAEPIIHFNMACYEAQLGHLPRARTCLAEAIRLEPACRQMALADDDLAPLHEELRAI